MIRFLLNLALGVVWCALWGSATAWNFTAGVLVGALVISAYSRAVGGSAYIGRGMLLVRFTIRYLRILVLSNCKVAWEVLTPRMHQRPRIVRYPVGGMSDAQRTMLANAITLTPGTLVVDVSPDDRWLYIHCMYASNREAALDELDALAADIDEGVFA